MGCGQSKERSQCSGAERLMADSGEDEDEERSHWSLLPPEMLELISAKVADAADYIRLRAVAATWRSAVRPINQAHPRLPPRLMLPYDQNSASRSFLSLAGGRVNTLDLPEARGKAICGSSYGWFVLLDAKTESVSLLNPVTGAQILLPPATRFPGLVGLRVTRFRNSGHESCEVSRVADGSLGFRGPAESLSVAAYTVYIWCAFLSSDPDSDSGSGSPDCCVVIAMSPVGPKFAFCRVGSDGWTVLDTTLPFRLAAVAYHGGRFYAVDIEGNCAVCDHSFKGSLVPSMKVPVSFDICNMVTSRGCGELLLITFRGGRRNNIHSDVFKLVEEGVMRWSKVSSIGDNAVYFSATHCSCVPARGIAGCTANCVYFLVPRRGYVYRRSMLHQDLNVRCMKDRDAGFEVLRFEIDRNVKAVAIAASALKVSGSRFINKISRRWINFWGVSGWQPAPWWI